MTGDVSEMHMRIFRHFTFNLFHLAENCCAVNIMKDNWFIIGVFIETNNYTGQY